MALPIFGYFMKKVYADANLKFPQDDFKPPLDYDPNLYGCDQNFTPQLFDGEALEFQNYQDMNKEVKNVEEALKGIEDGMTLMIGGFGLCGIPENSIVS